MSEIRHFILAPDSFKGTMSAVEVCTIMQAAILRQFPGAKVELLPMSDGGEGMVAAWLGIVGGEQVQAEVSGPFNEPIEASYGVLPDGTAVIEMAQCAGLGLVGENKNPAVTTTYGVGELILQAVAGGADRAIVGIGGSATNDCGLGMASALGYRFLDQEGNDLVPVGASLALVASIAKPAKLPDIEVIIASDVNNPLYGPQGAAHIYARQKGADSDLIGLLDAGLAHVAAIIRRDLGIDVAHIPGAGAAGGLGAGLMAFLGGTMRSGIELLLDAAKFDDLLEDADIIFTGEGRLDAQSVHGKVPAGVALRAKRNDVPTIALCGSLGCGAEALYDHGITAMFSSVRQVTDWDTLRTTCRDDLFSLTEAVVRMLRLRSGKE